MYYLRDCNKLTRPHGDRSSSVTPQYLYDYEYIVYTVYLCEKNFFFVYFQVSIILLFIFLPLQQIFCAASSATHQSFNLIFTSRSCHIRPPQTYIRLSDLPSREAHSQKSSILHQSLVFLPTAWHICRYYYYTFCIFFGISYNCGL